MKYKLTNSGAQKPEKGTVKSAGYDLFATEKLEIPPLHRASVNTGLILEIPEGYYGRIAPRSGLALKNGIDVLAGVVDSDYRGEIKVILFNTDLKNFFQVEPGQKIAQIIFEKFFDCEFQYEEALTTTHRGSGGFGSTDKNSQNS
jgi:dUTP pyrophosphatase